ncbi:hypothetical protein HUG17_9028 [Dermatophagoides farinae]|uniref:Uncharacterized protein n=1 Tax=Dermatophagoides farinae TaxID=6954 RepID=A0A9D4NTF3_DERFA|nr:hypothetical protein HUG17_9028 [Dermatophagoides farinae]
MSKILPYNKNNNNDDVNRSKEICPRLASKLLTNDDTPSQSSSSSSKLKSKIKIRNRSPKNNHRIHRPCRASAAAAAAASAREERDSFSFSKSKFPKNSNHRLSRHKNNDDDDENRSIVGRNRNGRSMKRKTTNNGRFRVPLRSRSIFVKIRQKGRNFGIRCKTSVELWRKWIKRGISWGSSNNNNDDNVESSMATPSSSSSKQMLNETMPSHVLDTKPVIKMIRKNIITDVIPEEDVRLL